MTPPEMGALTADQHAAFVELQRAELKAMEKASRRARRK